ncbi:plasma-membrane proton-efflux P-type ATPase [Micractinium conductrix]|uniref:Plasma membrane ATPase n=1 Tax=Micractinium conductrix TaxID=554055 RepID=A0A2P6VKE5_9CHLO|nr:plasma-membrane proton-efflux P-type ATPase [Micractinium conductrix]|eukprot:PSC74572.1 plasma-membrane proton-efflux P-type ATPase [Micractinium conductrix]
MADAAVAVNGEGGVGEEVDFKDVSEEQALSILKATHKGLTGEEAARRLIEYGPNKLPEETRNAFLVYLGYMWNPLSWAMEAAAIIAIALLDYADFALIVALLFVNATISYVEEANADKAIKALTSALAPKAKALRDGTVVTIDAADLVPGDIIIIRLGDIVPADIKILSEEGSGGSHEHETPVQCDQAALTGESLPVKKFSGDVCFAGSTIKQGERHCVVYATGMQTFFGRAAALLGSANQEANLQKVMTRIGALCLVTIGVWIVIELAVQFGHYKHDCYGGEGGCPTLTNMLVIIVGGIPIAMPTVLSVTLALGAFTLAKEGAIVSRMSAVEEMAGMDILCSDKTGTLTLNKLTVDHINVYPLSGHSIEEVVKYSALSANIVTEEPIDMVLHESHPNRDTLWEECTLARFIPFNPTDKYTVAYVKDKKTGEIERVMKGAPQVVVRNAHNAAEIEADCTAKITEYANRGFRGLGIAKAAGDGSSGTTWEMVGLVPLFDPPRHDTRDTIERCNDLGISVKMITGDQLLIGKETAKQLGMGTNMFTTEALLKAKQGFGLVEGHASVEDLVEEADGFAEVFPEHKFMIVKILQERRHMVGMTGDGVNDAPALKKADVGIAVAGATDAARGAADIVLTAPGLSAIVTAIIGARKIFQRMTTYSRYTVAMTFRICFTFGLLTVIYNWWVADFFDGSINMFSLQEKGEVLSAWCTDFIQTRGFGGGDPNADACTVYPDEIPCGEGITLEQQCMAEQKYVRGAMTRSLLYLQVSISGQAIVFVVRTISHSFFSRAGTLTYVAFFVAQFCATLISVFGFNGYEAPHSHVSDCQFCTLSSGGHNPFFSAREAPIAGTESAFTASVLGCTYYVIVAWVWSLIWHMGLDPLKWIMMYMLDEEGFRTSRGGMFGNVFRTRGERMGAGAGIGVNKMSMSRVSTQRVSMNRVSVGGYTSGGVPGVGGRMVPNANMLQRASFVKVR